MRTSTRHHHPAQPSQAPECIAYQRAKDRCTRRNAPQFPRYGGRGIEFRFKSFTEFLAHIGKRPSPRHQLNRINNDGHYEIGNVEWATPLAQMRNFSRNHPLTVDGVTRCISEWAEISGLNGNTIQYRVNHGGYCDGCAVKLPLRSKKCPH